MTETFTAKYVYRVEMMESERGWGRHYWHADFDTEEKQLHVLMKPIAETLRNRYRTTTSWQPAIRK